MSGMQHARVECMMVLQMAGEIAERYKNRTVNIMGEINQI